MFVRFIFQQFHWVLFGTSRLNNKIQLATENVFSTATDIQSISSDCHVWTHFNFQFLLNFFFGQLPKFIVISLYQISYFFKYFFKGKYFQKYHFHNFFCKNSSKIDDLLHCTTFTIHKHKEWTQWKIFKKLQIKLVLNSSQLMRITHKNLNESQKKNREAFWCVYGELDTTQ